MIIFFLDFLKGFEEFYEDSCIVMNWVEIFWGLLEKGCEMLFVLVDM